MFNKWYNHSYYTFLVQKRIIFILTAFKRSNRIVNMLIASGNKPRYKVLNKNKIQKNNKQIEKSILCYKCKKVKQSKSECFYSCNDCNEVFCENCITNCFQDGLFNAGLLLD